MRSEIERRLALRERCSMQPLSVFDAVRPHRRHDDLNERRRDAPHHRVENGSTWTAASTQRSALNTECKLLLLGHAFEALDCLALEQSRRAIERLVTQRDGIPRAHSHSASGALRDTAIYSITAATDREGAARLAVAAPALRLARDEGTAELGHAAAQRTRRLQQPTVAAPAAHSQAISITGPTR